ncbi:MAG TPA: type II CAAX endopeptidase family protein [Pirellulaceae bacterium]|nr:type II CAAX endopeptidase family protein [Pirellulaceae bacterium]
MVAREVTSADRFVAIAALLLPTVVTLVYFVALDGAAERVQQVAFAIGKGVQFGLPLVWVLGVQKDRLKFVRPDGQGLALGALFGLAVAGLMAAIYLLWLKPGGLMDKPAEEAREKIKSFGVDSVAAFAAMAVFFSAVHSLLEEYYFRWFAFGQLRRWINVPAAIGISSLAFAAHHVLILARYFTWTSELTWLFAAGVAIGGVAWAWLYQRTGSLWGPWLSHAIVDAAIFAIGYDLVM